MCLGGGSSPPPPPPPPAPPAEVKQPETIEAVREKRRYAKDSGMEGGTMLTGPRGVAASDLNVSKPTLLGQ